MENSEKTEQRVNLGEIWYAVKKNWLIEIIIFVVILAAGFVYTRINKDYYVATGTLVVKANIDEQQAMNNTTLSKQNVETVAQILKNSATLEKAGKPEGKLDLDYSSSNNAQTIIMKFTAPTKEGAVEGLKAIYAAGKEIVEKKDENGEQLYFSANVKIVLIEDRVSWTSQSDDLKIILLSLVGGIAAALVVTVLLYFINDKVSSVERTESVSGVKNLATIEKMKGVDENAEGYLKLDLKKLSDTLIYMEAGENKEVYQIQSAISGEGKSTVTVNLAVALGQSQRKVLIIDCDFSKPCIHRMFKLSKKTGITDYFKGDVDFAGMVKPTGEEGVDLITCGEVISNHTIFFASKKFEEIISIAKGKYDFVLLDGAPIKALSDYINLSKLSDGTILVVGNDKITSRDLDYSVKELNACDAHLVGTVFNFSQVSSKKRYYYYKYKKQ